MAQRRRGNGTGASGPHTEGVRLLSSLRSPTVAEEFCSTAARLVAGDRQTQHGDVATNFANIADLWNGWLAMIDRTRGDITLTPRDVGDLFELAKIARRHSGTYNPDDYIDAAGYAACAGELAAMEHADRDEGE